MAAFLIETFAAVLVIAAAFLVGLDLSRRITVLGFIFFTAASAIWLAIGLMEDRTSIIVQNAILTVGNGIGVYRYQRQTREQPSAAASAAGGGSSGSGTT